MTTQQIMEVATATLIIRRHFNNCPHCSNPDGVTEEFMEWLANSGLVVKHVTDLLNIQRWEVISNSDVDDALAECWAQCVVWWSSINGVAIVQTL